MDTKFVREVRKTNFRAFGGNKNIEKHKCILCIVLLLGPVSRGYCSKVFGDSYKYIPVDK